MIAWFRSRRPKSVHVQQVTREDMEAAYAWDKTLTEWFAMTDDERRQCRLNITSAPRFEVLV